VTFEQGYGIIIDFKFGIGDGIQYILLMMVVYIEYPLPNLLSITSIGYPETVYSICSQIAKRYIGKSIKKYGKIDMEKAY
jgi:hypothetical protein